MRKKSTRLLSAALAVCMMASTLPVSAFAAQPAAASAESSVSTQAEEDAVAIDATNFPDGAFRQYVADNFDKDKDGALNQTERNAVKEIRISNSGCTSLQGLKYFSKLTDLFCSDNNLTELDVSENPELKSLDCRENQLTELDVSNNSELESLDCYENQLSALNVSNHQALKTLSCSWNKPLSALDVSNCPALKTLSCEVTHLGALDVSTDPALEELYCGSAHLSVLVLGNHPNLMYLNCSENRLTSLNIIGSNAIDQSRYDRFHTYSNSYDIVVADNRYRLSKLPGNFDASKVEDSQGGSFDPESNILTVDPNATEVTYTYNCGTYASGDSIKAKFTLNVTHHTHHYGDWLHDETDHWKKCTDSDCPEPEESVTETKAPHDFDEDGVCKVCGYQRETAVPDAPAGGSDTGNIQGALSAVVVGAAAGAIIYEAGTGIYRVINMPGIPMPSNRIELAELLWEHAGKPEPVSTALYSDIDEGDTDAQKAARWAVEQDLMKDDADNNKFNPYFPVGKLRTCLTWNAAKEKGLFAKTEE